MSKKQELTKEEKRNLASFFDLLYKWNKGAKLKSERKRISNKKKKNR